MKLKLLMVASVSALGICSLHAQSTDASPCATTTGEQHQWHKHHHGFWKALDLTDAQRQQLHQLLQSDKSSNKGLMVNRLNAEKALHAAIVKNPNDETTILSLSAPFGNAKNDLTVQRAKSRPEH